MGEGGGRESTLHNGGEAAQNMVGVSKGWLDTLACMMY